MACIISGYKMWMLGLSQEKLQIKLKKEADEKKFKFAEVDGRTEQVGLLCLPGQDFCMSRWRLCTLQCAGVAHRYVKRCMSLADY